MAHLFLHAGCSPVHLRANLPSSYRGPCLSTHMSGAKEGNAGGQPGRREAGAQRVTRSGASMPRAAARHGAAHLPMRCRFSLRGVSSASSSRLERFMPASMCCTIRKTGVLGEGHRPH